MSKALPKPVALFFCALLAALLAILVYSKTAHSDGRDFAVYHLAARRFLHGEALYIPSEVFPFKYLPSTLFIFLPFSFFPLRVALNLYGLLLFSLFLCAPFVLARFLDLSWRAPRFWAGLLLALIGSLRFLDNEVHSSQVNFLCFALIAGGGGWVYARRKTWGHFLMGLGAIFKFHPLYGVLALPASLRSRKNFLVQIAAVLFWIFFPAPFLSLRLPQQLRETTPLYSMKGSTLCQGFFPFGVSVLGLAEPTIAPFLFFLPLGLLLWALLPKFASGDAQNRKGCFALTFSALILLGTTASPLPWQSTYSILWPILAGSFWLATRKEAALLTVIALFLGLSSRGVAGRAGALALELRQSVFLAALLIVGILAVQARRLERQDSGLR